MGAKRGNQNARKDGRGRISAPLSLSDERLAWAIECVKAQGQEPTNANVSHFVRDYCYGLIDMTQELAKSHGYGTDELIQMLVSGEVATIVLPDEQRYLAGEWLFAQAKTIIDPSLSDALESIARSLQAAAQREAKAASIDYSEYESEE